MSADWSHSNKRVAKNTMFLYARMLLLMVIGLYTSRVVLQALGVEDYGLYNVVGSVVTIFTAISGSLSASISRFITYELGRGDNERIKLIFSTSVNIQVILSFVFLLIAESLGLWYVNSILVVPDGRLWAANIVYQISIATFIINLLSVPYNAEIIAHEKMEAFAYISIIEGLGKLFIALALLRTKSDALILYAISILSLSLLIRVLYVVYCKKHFSECHYRFYKDWALTKEMFSFAGWNFIGATSAIMRDQGGNILINWYGGPAVNAARGIAVQVSNIVNSFVNNFTTAVNPQIIKSYASKEYGYLSKLVNRSSKYSFFLLLCFTVPLLIFTETGLDLWLEEVPEHTVYFARLALLFVLSESLSVPLMTAVGATGKIRNYQIVVGGLQMLNFPVSWILLHFTHFPEITMWVALAISQICLFARLIMAKSLLPFSPKTFLFEVYFPTLAVGTLSFGASYLVKGLFDETVLAFFLLSLVSVCITASISYWIGCNSAERAGLNDFIRKFLKRSK